MTDEKKSVLEIVFVLLPRCFCGSQMEWVSSPAGTVACYAKLYDSVLCCVLLCVISRNTAALASDAVSSTQLSSSHWFPATGFPLRSHCALDGLNLTDIMASTSINTQMAC